VYIPKKQRDKLKIDNNWKNNIVRDCENRGKELLNTDWDLFNKNAK
jgi:hypothetical protein